ncbi:endonuclease/exonuclease/phosphatase family protein [Papillibacter cinnamivorans]|uniref:Endonuclease/Exonuclease/phosphatase family protein n=1 Tax=Papillibacter cinnamivorans DSM 12816 TaxID=1122930 RepID=A0A1W2CP05_9FIRM|nr:endonuclease/exonuclease/phosphatase family protein [Papillibacter cinnamivorans]SMC86756.1 Endonuclease/Exonuclease/phosphatase family protein [Papillibacter cinnamivorans DSM 12816]
MKKLMKMIAIVILVVVLAAGSYVAYVFIAYHRVEDNLALEVDGVSSDMPQPGVTYTLTTFNVGYGAYSRDYSFFMDGGKYSRAYSKEEVDKNITGAAGVISNISPDFAFFQEVDTNATRSYHVDEYAMFQDNFPACSSVFAVNYDSPYLLYPITDPIGKSVSGIATFSKYFIRSSLRRSLPLESGFRKLLDLDRCYTVTRIPVSNSKELILINVHLSAFTADVTIGEEQLKMLFEDAQREYDSGNYVIVGGDFNKDLMGNSPELFGTTRETPVWAKPINTELIPDCFTLVRPENKEDLLPTLRSTDAGYVEGVSFVTVLDGFLVSDNITVVHEAHIQAGFLSSDHNPVLLQFQLD